MAATTTDQATTAKDAFVTVRGDRRSEVARTLAQPVPQALGLLDQFGLWGNLGVSLLGFTGAIFVLQPAGAGTPGLSLAAALAAIVVGFVTYQLINPGYVSWWASAWSSFGHDIGFTAASWMSASILSFAVAAAVTLLTGFLLRGRRR